MTLGALTFLSPWLLAGLAALPIIYWLLRTVPPRPRQIRFPGTRILVGLENAEKTPDKTPWWLMLIRMAAAALVILALAQPILNPDRSLSVAGGGPVVIVVDNGWSAGADWDQRQSAIDRILKTAEGEGQSVVLVETAGRDVNVPAVLEAPAAARRRAAALLPQPFAPDRAVALEQIRAAVEDADGVSIVWLSDGLDHGSGADFAAGLADIAGGGVTVMMPGNDATPLAVSAGLGAEGKLRAKVIRAFGDRSEGILHALSARGEVLSESRFAMTAGTNETTVDFALPLELRNQVTRVVVSGVRSAGATHLLDARSRWNRVGLISGASQEQSQPLLGPLHYIHRALTPFAEIVESRETSASGSVDEILRQNASIMVLADIGTLDPNTTDEVSAWLERGGVLVRFAGPRMEEGQDGLLPVELRSGGRTLGGALSWSEPQGLSAFEPNSLFAGLDVPGDVRINRQVLADPGAIQEGVDVWARLADGTPLVTARRFGEGRIVLFHVTANAEWSNLPLSGLFVEMLRRITTLGTASAARSNTEPTMVAADGNQPEETSLTATVLAPTEVLDGFGQLVQPTASAKPIDSAAITDMKPSKTHPPGYYGSGDSARSLNLIDGDTQLTALGPPPAGAAVAGYGQDEQTDLKPWFLGTALALLLVDVLAVLAIQFGGLAGLMAARGARTSGAASVAAACIGLGVALSLVVGLSSPVRAQTSSESLDLAAAEKALLATSQVTFGYVLTGDQSIDATSKAGLEGLVRVLAARTSVEPGEPMPVTIEADEIAFFPILYWPVSERAGELSPETLAKVDGYMKRGGMIIFDTRDYGQGLPMGLRKRGVNGETPLQRLLGKLDIPPLEPVPEGHVLTKSFYLLQNFPGRWEGGELWVEATEREESGGRQARRSDGVSSILITPNDFASAWALDAENRPMFPVVPGGPRQREWAFRTGINTAMYALTGNYKADQVHVPSLLQRLGQ